MPDVNSDLRARYKISTKQASSNVHQRPSSTTKTVSRLAKIRFGGGTHKVPDSISQMYSVLLVIRHGLTASNGGHRPEGDEMRVGREVVPKQLNTCRAAVAELHIDVPTMG